MTTRAWAEDFAPRDDLPAASTLPKLDRPAPDPRDAEIARLRVQLLDMAAERDRLRAALRSRTRQRDSARSEVFRLRRELGLLAEPVIAAAED